MDVKSTSVTREMIDIALLASDGIDHPERETLGGCARSSLGVETPQPCFSPARGTRSDPIDPIECLSGRTLHIQLITT
jgi:hypothetical protein